MDPDIIVKYDILAHVIDEMDYYQILKVAPTASPAEVRNAFHAESREFHPDNFMAVSDPEIREKVLKIAKRITEAYTVLREHDKRRRYDALLALPDGRRKIRFTEEDDQKKPQAEEAIKSPQARKLFQQGMLDLKAGRFAQAEKSFKLAMMYEPANETLRQAAEAAGKMVPVSDFAIK